MAEGRRTCSARGVGHRDGRNSACCMVVSSDLPWSTRFTERGVQRLMKRFNNRSNSGSDLCFWKQEYDCVFSWFSLVGVGFSLQTLP